MAYERLQDVMGEKNKVITPGRLGQLVLVKEENKERWESFPAKGAGAQLPAKDQNVRPVSHQIEQEHENEEIG